MSQATSVMQLRMETGMPVAECQKAFRESDGDVAKAKQILRLAAGPTGLHPEKKESGAGLLVAAKRNDVVSFVEISTATQAAANTPEAIAAGQGIATSIAAGENPDPYVYSIAGILKEPVAIVKSKTIELKGKHLEVYVHHNRRVISAVLFNQAVVDTTMARQIVLHLASVVPEPLAVDRSGLPADALAVERGFLEAKAASLNKPTAIAAKIIEGGIAKWQDSVSLLTQPLVMDPKKTVKSILPDGVTIEDFVLWKI